MGIIRIILKTNSNYKKIMKIKIVLFLLITIIATSFVQAQQPMLEWAKSCNGLLNERVNGIAVDGSGNVYTTGSFEGTVDFDSGVGVANLTAVGLGDRDAFVSKFDVNGNFVWVKQFGENPGWEEGFAITVDASGNVYTTGFFKSTVDFDPGSGVFNLTETGFGSGDMFISKLDTNGNFIFAKQIGGNGSEIPRAITLDVAGNIYTTGEIDSAMLGTTILTTDFDPGSAVFPLSSTTGLESDVFISKLDASGNFVWAKNMGGNYSDNANSLALDASNNVYITGTFRNVADFDPSTSVANLTAIGNSYNDIFVAKYDTNGNYVWAKAFGSTNKDDFGYGIKVDALGNVFSTGTFQGTVDFDSGVGVANIVGNAFGNNNYILKLDTNGIYVWAKTFSGTGAASRAIDLDSAGNIYTTGYFSGTCDFDPNAAVANITAIGGAAFHFVSKLDSSGNFVWAKGFGNTLNINNNTFGQVIKVDSNFNVHTAGTYNSTVDFDPCPTIVNLPAIGGYDIFVQKLNQNTTGSPTFATIPAICSGTIAPVLPTTSTNSVTGTWSPSTVSNTISGTYIFTPDAGQCITATTTLTITVNPNITTTFTQIIPFCSSDSVPVLPTTSTNGIVGTWNPSTINNTASGAYVFTPITGQCGTVYTMNITVNTATIPTFTQVAAICAGASLSALPITSNNGITGTWSPAINNMATTTYNFTPTIGICATTQTMTITVNSTTPTFTQVTPICSGEALSALPIISNNGITGTWSPALDNTITKTYTFNPTVGQCASIQTMTITVNTPIVPTFTQVNPICTGGTLTALPTTSNNTILGTWSPALDNTITKTYTFTPNSGQCATTQTMTITVGTAIVPTFTQVSAICAGSTLAALPSTSTNGIAGTWSPIINNSATTTYTFSPSAGQCAVLQTMMITVNTPTIPTFTQVAAICTGATLSALPTTSINGITGTWSPALNNLATTTYTFTPNSGQCAPNQTMTIDVNSVTPIFNQIAPICLGDNFAGLTSISNNGISGTWSPAPNNLATTTYTFTPNAWQCATVQTMTVEINPFVQLSVSINQLEYFNSENKNIEVTVSPVGTYAYSLDEGNFQTSNIFENVSSCDHKILVKDLAGCGKSNVTISFFIWDYPRFFTPNNDGYNDYWNIFCNNFKPLKITIYDRYGKILKQFLSTSLGWDGKYNGNVLISDDYWFTVEYTENGENKIFKSHFAMKR
jgi:gliding motility-associated-like protein